MTFKLRSIAAATSAALIMGFGANAMADSSTDIVNALVSKGILTEEEGALLTKGREGEQAGQEKAMKKAGKLKISDAVDNATVYGDVRVRYEGRSGNGVATSGATIANAKTLPAPGTPIAAAFIANSADKDQNRERARYKVTLGVKTESGDWYTDLALAMGGSGRSDNATFGKTTGSLNDKETIYVKRAMLGYKATDWLTLEAGRMENPLYTTSMVWDADLTVEGLTEKIKYKVGDAELFGTAGQWAYKGDRSYINSAPVVATSTNELFAFQGGAKYLINDQTSVKAALTYSKISSNNTGANFIPGLASIGSFPAAFMSNAAVNDLETLEIPAEVNYMASSNIGLRLFGDYAYNMKGSDRFNNAVLATRSALTGNAAVLAGNAVQAAGNDNSAWMLGVAIGSAKDLKAFEGNKMAKGDWSARLWYQDVGAYAVDQNAVDSDIFDSRVNMKGTILKAQYNVQDNVIANFTYGHGARKNNALGTPTGGGNDLGLNLGSIDLLQLDLTYKF